LTSSSLFAQREAENWIFGSFQKMNFSNSSPLLSTIPIVLNQGGAACMSDKNGNFVFASEGYIVYNRLYQQMPGALFFSLQGNSSNGQGIITIPYPDHDSLYYLFYIENQFSSHFTPRLRCALINMNKQNGMGDIVMKDSLLLNGDSVCLKITAAQHCNKKDVWLIGHRKNSNQYFSYLITSNGISSVPVYSTGGLINNSDNYYNHKGYMKVSPIGDKNSSLF